MTDNIDPNETINARWCKDSETSEMVLIDIQTGKILCRLPPNSSCLGHNKPSIVEDKDETK